MQVTWEGDDLKTSNFCRDGASGYPVFELPAEPKWLPSNFISGPKTMPLRFNVGLAPLPPGDYNCQVTVLDPTGQKSAFWQAPITIVP